MNVIDRNRLEQRLREEEQNLRYIIDGATAFRIILNTVPVDHAYAQGDYDYETLVAQVNALTNVDVKAMMSKIREQLTEELES